MTTAKELRIWANTVRQWRTKIGDTVASERLAQAAAEIERLANQKEVGERQLV